MPSVVRIGSAVLVLLGLALVSGGVYGDANGWWDGRPFLLNLYSGITSACFGIPVALVILRIVTEHQAQHSLELANGQLAKDTMTVFFHTLPHNVLGISVGVDSWRRIRDELTLLQERCIGVAQMSQTVVRRHLADLNLRAEAVRDAIKGELGEMPSQRVRPSQLAARDSWSRVKRAAELPSSGFGWFFSAGHRAEFDETLNYLCQNYLWLDFFSDFERVASPAAVPSVSARVAEGLRYVEDLDRVLRSAALFRAALAEREGREVDVMWKDAAPTGLD
jgi:hypothetical protein